jgi:DNA-directed RNA polymerase subunit M/transcription elongation factor TFIIS
VDKLCRWQLRRRSHLIAETAVWSGKLKVTDSLYLLIYIILECDKVINVREFSYEKKVIDFDEEEGAEKEHGVQVDHICTKCGHTQATYSTQQTRLVF